MDERLEKIAAAAFMKIAGYRLIKRVLDAERKTNKKRLFTDSSNKDIDEMKDIIRNRPQGIHSILDYLRETSKRSGAGISLNTPASELSYNVGRHLKLDPYNLPVVRERPGNLNMVVADMNKYVDTLNSRYHGKMSPEEFNANRVTKPLPKAVEKNLARAGKGVLDRAREPFYYTGRSDLYLPESQPFKYSIKKGDPIWVSKYPSVAAGYGETVFKLKNTPELTAGGSKRSHGHIAADSRGMSSPELKVHETLSRIKGKMSPKSFNSYNPQTDYERVLNYNPETFRKNITDIYTVGHPKYTIGEPDLIQKTIMGSLGRTVPDKTAVQKRPEELYRLTSKLEKERVMNKFPKQ